LTAVELRRQLEKKTARITLGGVISLSSTLRISGQDVILLADVNAKHKCGLDGLRAGIALEVDCIKIPPPSIPYVVPGC